LAQSSPNMAVRRKAVTAVGLRPKRWTEAGSKRRLS
jgi:hypothetical protein